VLWLPPALHVGPAGGAEIGEPSPENTCLWIRDLAICLSPMARGLCVYVGREGGREGGRERASERANRSIDHPEPQPSTRRRAAWRMRGREEGAIDNT